MYIALALWICAALLEAALYSSAHHGFMRSKQLRSTLGGLSALALVATEFGMFGQIGALWLPALILAVYRLINLTRFVYYRLRPVRLGSVALQSQRWITAGQIGLVLVAHLCSQFSAIQVISGMAVLQLLTALVLLRSCIQTWEHARGAGQITHVADRDLPTLSVLIPARDETDELQRCLLSVVTNDYPKLEVIVLDDCSSQKRTSEIIRSFAQSGVRFIKGNTVPDDWLAKNYGYEQLRNEASGELLLFCGADTTFGKQTLRHLVETMLTQHKTMLSVLPARAEGTAYHTLLQSMRYYWELCFPRRLFKRPPVLSSCWLITAQSLEDYGGLHGVAQSVTPEAYFARRAVVGDEYTFLRNNTDMQVYSSKNFSDQFMAAVRYRYPQLHKRLELVVLCSIFELVFFVFPFFGLIWSLWLPAGSAFFAIWFACVVAVEAMYYLIAVHTKLQKPWYALFVASFSFMSDIIMLHLSMLRYEFGSVTWKGRNICIPVMHLGGDTPSQKRA